MTGASTPSILLINTAARVDHCDTACGMWGAHMKLVLTQYQPNRRKKKSNESVNVARLALSIYLWNDCKAFNPLLGLRDPDRKVMMEGLSNHASGWEIRRVIRYYGWVKVNLQLARSIWQLKTIIKNIMIDLYSWTFHNTIQIRVT